MSQPEVMMNQQAIAVLNVYEEGGVTAIVSYLEYLHPDWDEEKIKAAVREYGNSYDNKIDWEYWLDYLVTTVPIEERKVP